MTGAATQVYSPRFDKRFADFPKTVQRQIEARIFELGLRLHTFPHRSLQGVDAFRLRVGDYRVISQFDIHRNILLLLTVGHRRDVYEDLTN